MRVTPDANEAERLTVVTVLCVSDSNPVAVLTRATRSLVEGKSLTWKQFDA